MCAKSQGVPRPLPLISSLLPPLFRDISNDVHPQVGLTESESWELNPGSLDPMSNTPPIEPSHPHHVNNLDNKDVNNLVGVCLVCRRVNICSVFTISLFGFWCARRWYSFIPSVRSTTCSNGKPDGSPYFSRGSTLSCIWGGDEYGSFCVFLDKHVCENVRLKLES